LLGDGRKDVDRFIEELFEVEEPALSGRGDFIADLAEFLARWNMRDRVADVLQVLTTIELDAAMASAVAALRSAGIRCYLATNQEAHRASYMSKTLRYGEVFDGEFYSYRLGFTKPDPSYFRAIVEALSLAPSSLLLIDDHEPNVATARQLGLNAALFTADKQTSGDVLRTILAAHGA
jgi:putative hydrolase of the HAD superfamily